jgi:D-galactarolactone cycloisomerase
VLAPLALLRDFRGPAEAFAFLTERTAVLAIQSGEAGPIAQTIAGIDLALWDLCARRAAQPLWRYLGGSRDDVPVYASGINPDQPEAVVAARRAEGYRAFKLKVGFGREKDIANLRNVRELLGPEAPLMVDANQAWSLDEARAMAPELEQFGLAWLEEPLRADRPWHEWQALARVARTPLAAGENALGEEAFDAAIDSATLAVLQPDLAKWGGVSGCWPVIGKARARGLRYCPHYLGAGVGLMASAHVLSAAGGDGLLEVDANPNPLRTELSPRIAKIAEGRCSLGDAPGIGVTPDLKVLAGLASSGA